MTKAKRRHPERDFTPTHPNAAAIDIGSRMHVTAVPPDRDPEPVRAFGTCTGDLQLLPDWFERCGVRTVAMEEYAFCESLANCPSRPSSCRSRKVRMRKECVESRVAIQSDPFIDPPPGLHRDRASGRLACPVCHGNPVRG